MAYTIGVREEDGRKKQDALNRASGALVKARAHVPFYVSLYGRSHPNCAGLRTLTTDMYTRVVSLPRMRS